ncbi:hypothetical protein GLOIN_2v1824437 [Rhizophagus clarus]|uniref:Uncharacterized protein n=1 Tax=Rhizophagus clarus TaxID=94130 RepID=A0A8H3QSI4_9GLOM|nr:hypothetical protein GLOIN_2v1824437 [Rhizophagus clarus]
MNASKNYLGRDKQNTTHLSYHGFLNSQHDAIINISLLLVSSSSSSFSNWKNLDDYWALKFLKEAKNLEHKSTFDDLKEKINIERLLHQKYLQAYWQEIIKDNEKENLISTTPHSKKIVKNENLFLKKE